MGAMMLLVAMLISTASAQITSVADLEGVYNMEWKGYYWSAFGEWLGQDGSTTVKIRAIEGTDSIEIKGFMMDGCVAKAKVDVDAMTVSIPKQKVSETVLEIFSSIYTRKFDAIGYGIEDWDWEVFVPTNDLLTGTLKAEKTISIRGPMVLFQWNDIYNFPGVVEKIKLTYDSPLPNDDPQEPVRGDINGDGVVDVSDVNIVINIMLGKE